VTDDEIIDVVLQFEGGFVNNLADRGGATNFGITAATLGKARNLGRPATVDEVRALSRADAAAIYKRHYVTDPKFSSVTNDDCRLILVDTGVLHGPARSVAFLRQCLSLPISAQPQSQLDDATITNANNFARQAALPSHILALRLKSYTDIVKQNPSQAVFLRGWVNRVGTLLERV
jgi:lysozyme family protein